MLDGVEVLCHSSIRISKGKIIYIDPFRIKEGYNDADYIFITHEHYDHFSPEDINKVRKGNSIIIVPESMSEKVSELNFKPENVKTVIPNIRYYIDGFMFDTVNAYNIDKNFHLKENRWVGYIIYINGISYYIAGDTDVLEENKNIKCDVAFVPVGGKYTMTYKEAAKLINSIKPKVAIPTHYGEIVGDKEYGDRFTKLLEDSIKFKILIE